MRVDLTEKVLANDRISSRHFISRKPATLQDESSPDWTNLGISKQVTESRARAAEERWDKPRLWESLKEKAKEGACSSASGGGVVEVVLTVWVMVVALTVVVLFVDVVVLVVVEAWVQ